jgi:hypothetical protein
MTIPKPVVYVFGNHEPYGDKISSLREKARLLAAGSNVHFLEKDSVVIDGVRFLGATLYTDYALYGNPSAGEMAAQLNMNDFKKVRNGVERGYSKVRPQDYRIDHQMAKNWLQDELAKPFDGRTVIVSHHAPSEQSIAPDWRGKTITPSYASNLENVMLYNDIALWCHGHIHDTSDYQVGDTRVICNPKGYDDYDVNPNFNPKLVVEV